MIRLWIILLLFWRQSHADVSHILEDYDEDIYNLEPAASITHRPIYAVPLKRYDQVVAASSHAEKYSYDPPETEFNPYVAASKKKPSYSYSDRGYDYSSSASDPLPTFTDEESEPTLYVNDNIYSYDNEEERYEAASAVRPFYSGYTGHPTYAGYDHRSTSYHHKPKHHTAHSFRPTYAGYQAISAASEIRAQHAPYGYEATKTINKNPSYNSKHSSYQASNSGQYNHKIAIRNGMYNPKHTKRGMYQYYKIKTPQYRPEPSEERSYYSETPFVDYEAEASKIDTVLKSDGYYYNRPAIPFDPAPPRKAGAPSVLYDDAPPPPPTSPPVRKPYRYHLPPKQPHNYDRPPPTRSPTRQHQSPTKKLSPVHHNPPIRTNVVKPTYTPPKRTNLDSSTPLVRITPRTTSRPRATALPVENTTPYLVTIPPPKVSDVVLLAYSASTISPHISPDVYSPPPDASATVRPYKVQNPDIIKALPDPFDTHPAPFLPTNPVTPIKVPESYLEPSASEENLQYLPAKPEQLEEDGYHYDRPSVPFY